MLQTRVGKNPFNRGKAAGIERFFPWQDAFAGNNQLLPHDACHPGIITDSVGDVLLRFLQTLSRMSAHLFTRSTLPSAHPFGFSADPFPKPAPAGAARSVLVIEDDIDTSFQVCRELENHGFEPVPAYSGEEGLAAFNSRAFSLVLLDRMLPGCNGLEVLKALRARGHAVPVFLMSMLDALEDRVLGLDHGADDYLVKPLAIPELIARIRAQLRRTWGGANLQRRIGDLVLHLDSRRVARGTEEIALTPREFDVLRYLAEHHDRVVSRDMLARDVWRVAHRGPSLDNSIDVHIAHLRRKIDAEGETKLIHTVRGEGFMLVEKIPSLSEGGAA